MDISFDPAKRAANLIKHGLDFADAGRVFAGQLAEIEDMRRDYGESRFVTAGMVDERLVVVVWTLRDSSRRIISMRFAYEREAVFWRSADG